MIELGLHVQALQFDEATQGSKERVGLGGDRLRRRLRQRDLLFKRLVRTLHLPPCVRDRGQVVKRSEAV